MSSQPRLMGTRPARHAPFSATSKPNLQLGSTIHKRHPKCHVIGDQSPEMARGPLAVFTRAWRYTGGLGGQTLPTAAARLGSWLLLLRSRLLRSWTNVAVQRGKLHQKLLCGVCVGRGAPNWHVCTTCVCTRGTFPSIQRGNRLTVCNRQKLANLPDSSNLGDFELGPWGTEPDAAAVHPSCCCHL